MADKAFKCIPLLGQDVLILCATVAVDVLVGLSHRMCVLYLLISHKGLLATNSVCVTV